MSKLGVIQIIDSLNTGGAEVMSVNIANLLVDESVDSHLCVTRQEGKLIENISKKVGYLFLNRKKKIDIIAIIRLKKYIKKNNITILHAHSSSFFIAFCIKLISPKVQIIWHDHYGKTQKLNKRKRFPLKQISFFFTSIISVNNQLKLWATKNLYCNNIYKLNNFPIFNNKDHITILEGIKNKRIVHLAAFREQKNHETIIDSFSQLLREYEGWTLHFIGNIYNDLYSRKIKNLIKEKKLEKHTFVYGSCLDVPNILKQATIGVLSSKSEGLPIALLEYGLAKLPVLTTNVGDCKNVIINNKTGFVVSPENISEFTYKLKKLMDSEELRKGLGENLHKHVRDNFSSKAFINQLIKIYNN